MTEAGVQSWSGLVSSGFCNGALESLWMTALLPAGRGLHYLPDLSVIWVSKQSLVSKSFPALTSPGFSLCQHHAASFSTLPLLCSTASCISPSPRLARGLAFQVCCGGSGERILASSLCCFSSSP